MSATPLRLLLSAYQCGPGMGSVSQIGWEWYSRLAAQASVTLVTHIRNRECLTAAGAPLPGSEIIYIDTEWFARPLFRLASKLFPGSQHAVFVMSSLDFFLYDWVALRRLKARHGDWTLVHSATPVSPLAATRLYRLGLPLIVGPWNGGLPSSAAFPEIMAQDPAWVYRIRSLGRLADRILGCTRNAAMILSATLATDRALPPGVRTLRMIENGVDLKRFHPLETPRQAGPLRVVFVGRLLPFKGVPMLLEAIEIVRKDVPISLTIVGDGPQRQELEADASRRGLAGLVTFTGETSLAEVANHMRAADLFCLPSIRESGGAVVLEAMASGLPVIAVDYGGPAELVDDEVGRAISAEGPRELVQDLCAAFRDIAADRDRWRRRGIAGRSRAEKRYGWDAKIRSALLIYRQLLQHQQEHVTTLQEGGIHA